MTFCIFASQTIGGFHRRNALGSVDLVDDLCEASATKSRLAL